MSSFAVFTLDGENLGEGKTASEAIINACGKLDKMTQVRLTEFHCGSTDTQVIWLRKDILNT